MEPILRMVSISKYFGTFAANDDVSLEVQKGEIHSLLGENGAGKSTLMNVLYGLYKPEKGEIFFDGNRLNLNSSKDAIDVGIGMIHQHFMLIPVHTVLENVIMGMGKEKGFVIDEEKLEKEILDIANKYGMKISLHSKVSDLSVGEQQRVEIVKALYRGAKLLIMDEPTAVLTPQETEELFSTLRKMADGGMSIILITHKLNEVMSVCDRVTVLRDGKVTGRIDIKNTNELELTKAMIGRELSPVCKDNVCCKGERVLELKDVSYEDAEGIKALNNINLHLCSGEVLGIAGVDGNGQKELAEVIAGLVHATSGNVFLYNEEITRKSISEIINMSVGYIPEDRHKRGLVLDFSVSENLIMKDYCKSPFRKKLFFDFNVINSHAENMIDKYSIKTPGKNAEARKLSGGNQQKIVVAREVDKQPRLLIAVQPTRGVDIGAIEFIHKQIMKAKEQGTAVLLISTELSEINLLSDRIAVIYKGEIVGEIDHSEFEESTIGLMMAGIPKEKAMKS
ncbi:ABC transporter ATP-binding protein [Proteiniborus sp. MB09-C3]|uniref:ABC transporter ATP-binding protein n=1 Tax=Proteiniborus sp. MB09-C3 TaxID=3050072 RepID=UPI0025552EFD|nr:ABC transporter ATP-binding protein [Proteiniborus sp. MB09-C3]WIV12372.1 ABC transporter ATP-binding protein [Proteiniborus sp. MB09-C3]